MKRFFSAFLFFGAAGLFILQGCAEKSYPAARLKESVVKICQTEYGIDDVDVKIVGDTFGVYLPLTKLFAADFKETAVTGKVRNMESLFEPSPEALEKIEDVLFTISRVILSTDKEFKFYVLQATDTDKTGMQYVLTGNVADVKRVRVWDISRNEYRKRITHELKLNRAVIAHKPVHQFFKEISTTPVETVRNKYFGPAISIETLQNLFFKSLWTGTGNVPKTQWKIIDIRSAAFQKNQAMVYAKVRAPLGEQQDMTDLQYIFLIAVGDEGSRIVRIIPFQYKDEKGELHRIAFPKELQIQDSLDRWETEFDLQDVKLGSFLAAQVSRRVQAIAAVDERIQNTFRDVKLEFEYHDENKENQYFSLSVAAVLKDLNHYTKGALIYHEDIIYLLNAAFREFVDVIRSYQFGDYRYLRLNLAQDPPWVFGLEDLESFRRKKIDFQGLLQVPKG